MEESKYIFIYPTVEIRINLTDLFKNVCDEIHSGILEGELDEDDFDEDVIDDIIENYCYDTIYEFTEMEVDGTIDDLDLEDVQKELLCMLKPHIDELLKLCNKK